MLGKQRKLSIYRHFSFLLSLSVSPSLSLPLCLSLSLSPMSDGSCSGEAAGVILKGI